MKSFTEGGATTTYTYDPYNQLLSGLMSNSGGANYAYDLSGNILTTSVGKTVGFFEGTHQVFDILDTNNQYGPSNEITNTKAIKLPRTVMSTGSGSYDSNGNLLSVGGPIYTYDSQNRLTKVASGNKVTTFTYDGIGRVVQVVDQVGGAVVANHSYAWCGNVRCAEYDNTRQIPSSTANQTTAATDKFYFKQGMTVLATEGASRSAYYVADALGSIRGLFSGNSLIAQYEYDPYGTRSKVAGTNIDSDFGFAGYFHHGATGLDLARHRVYSAQLGRWLTRDPIGNLRAFGDRTRFNATDWNLYGYCRNNPASCEDPSGLAGRVFNIGIAIGAGCFYGGEFEFGAYLTWGGARGFDYGRYLTTSIGNTTPSLDFDPVISYTWDADQFFGEGAEIGIGPVGIQQNSVDDGRINGVEFNFGTSLAEFWSFHYFQNYTFDLGKDPTYTDYKY